MHYFLLIFFVFSTPLVAQEKVITFTESSIGTMKIHKHMEISLHRISNFFPFYKVTQRIGRGDSPDYHSFTVSSWESEELIEFISYIKDSDGYEESVVKLDEVISCSKYVSQTNLVLALMIDLVKLKRLGKA